MQRRWFIRRLQRYMLLIGELGIAGAGLFCSFYLGVGFTLIFVLGLGWQSDISLLPFLTGLSVGLYFAVRAFRAFRRRTRSWEIAYEVDAWARRVSKRKLHPTRARYRRPANRIGIWAPACMAAMVLCFFPVMTHLTHPASHYLKRYKIPIPWNMAALSAFRPGAAAIMRAYVQTGARGRFGITCWTCSPSSEMSFESLALDDRVFAADRKYHETAWATAKSKTRRDFQLGNVPFTCWDYRDDPWPAHLRYIACETPPDVRVQNLYAWFDGSSTDVPIFYNVIEKIRLN